MQTLLALCRPGFEKECIAALADACARAGYAGFGRAEPESGYARYELHEGDARELLGRLSLDELVFVRDLFATGGPLAMVPPDRLAALGPVLESLPSGLLLDDDVAVAAPDTNAGRELATLARQLGKPVAAALRARGLRLAANNPWRFLWFMADGSTAFACVGKRAGAPPWPQGVPRLKLLREAPSRSALKLEEAWHLFIPRDDWGTRLCAGRTAVDLGAAPGGWTWLMVRRGMRVTAVDNGPLAEVLRDDPLVTHLRADGFAFQPPQPVDWLVCDMVEKPSRVAMLVARWLTRGWCRQAIFNLKLPMKQRYAEVKANLATLFAELDDAGLRYEWHARQLYHDREEITVCLRLIGGQEGAGRRRGGKS